MDVTTLGIKISKDKKYEGLLKECYEYSNNSDHPSTHTAALLIKDEEIILKGANVFPPGVNHLEYRLNPVNRNIYINHAERDVIYKAAREGISTNDLTMVMPWLPCIPCADAIITSGISRLICHKQMIERTREKWQDELKESVKIMQEAGVDIIAYDGQLGVKAYMHGKEWIA